MQTTISKPVRFSGVGLHLGRPVAMTVRPAPAGSGVRFRRIDAGGVVIPARWTHAEAATLCTRIGDGQGLSVSTIEHVMAALAGCGIHNALIDIDAEEVPILDGSAAPFVDAFLAAGLRPLSQPLQAIRVLAPVEVVAGEACARLEPAETLEIAFAIAFEDDAIGRQELFMPMANGAFVHELCDSRTFCRLRDVEAMRARGLALGGSFDNALVFEGGRVLSPGGLRRPDEPVRHKMLDAMGDLALAGAPLLARYTGVRSGHAMTLALLRSLFATTAAWEWVTLDEGAAARLPGAGVVPQRPAATAGGRPASRIAAPRPAGGLRASA